MEIFDLEVRIKVLKEGEVKYILWDGILSDDTLLMICRDIAKEERAVNDRTTNDKGNNTAPVQKSARSYD
tara:strand:- start:235 stop:444 length:210 start_codon:yes stop_codon:yes gene_type:complete